MKSLLCGVLGLVCCVFLVTLCHYSRDTNRDPVTVPHHKDCCKEEFTPSDSDKWLWEVYDTNPKDSKEIERTIDILDRKFDAEEHWGFDLPPPDREGRIE